VTFDVPVTVDTRWSSAWVRLMCALRYVVGDDRAGRWAVWGAYKFARVKVASGRLKP
jgi:hypothetical protein